MGVYLNPSKSIFNDCALSEIYVDKSGLLQHLNRWVSRDGRFVCLTRPRRFGKSMAAAMIAAYYCNAYDSHDIFDKLEVHTIPTYEQHINQYAVISFDAQSFRDRVDSPLDFVPSLHRAIGEELKAQWPDILADINGIANQLIAVHARTGTKFVILIDEWDSIFRRDRNNEKATKDWVQFLRSVFKSAEAREYIALAYITGILPIKKYDVESSLNLFDEYTMLSSRPLEPYFGFTPDEVSALCKEYDMDYDETMRWYDGYRISRNVSVCNPRAVTQAMRRGEFDVYWSQTGSFEVLKDYINMNFDGLKDAISQMLIGTPVPVNTIGFNTSIEIKTKNDVLTALIHLGYLTYDFDTKTAWIPNNEIRNVIETAVTDSDWTKVLEQLQKSRDFMDAIQRADSAMAAQIIEDIHNDISVPIHYNSEGDLTATLLHACYAARDYCILARELPSSRGYADVVLIPTGRGKQKFKPTIFELKLNDTAQSAIKQIEERKYISVKMLRDYHGDVLTVAMVYDKKAGTHRCEMRMIQI
ncbi:MAG: AAA family ATPase [Proteobacteria bacterium]|nr:AAA family ATPase [Pseudomonadota bacterium]